MSKKNRKTEVVGNATASFVYFIQQGRGGPIKIGVATDPRDRLASLQTATPFELRLLAAMPGSFPEEKVLHARFHAHHIRGEWFNPAPWLMEEIEHITKKEQAAGRDPVNPGKPYLPDVHNVTCLSDALRERRPGRDPADVIADPRNFATYRIEMIRRIILSDPVRRTELESAVAQFVQEDALPCFGSHTDKETEKYLSLWLAHPEKNAEDVAMQVGMSPRTGRHKVNQFLSFAAAQAQELADSSAWSKRRPLDASQRYRG